MDVVGQQAMKAGVDTSPERSTNNTERNPATSFHTIVAVPPASAPTTTPPVDARRETQQARATKRLQEHSLNVPPRKILADEKSATKQSATGGIYGKKSEVELVNLDSEIGIGFGDEVIRLVESSSLTNGSNDGFAVGTLVTGEYGFAATDEFIDYSDSDAEELMPVGRRAAKPPDGENTCIYCFFFVFQLFVEIAYLWSDVRL